MDIKDSYLHGTVGVVKSISVSADKLTYNLADINNTAKTITLPLATTTANGLMSKDDKIAINSLGNYVTLNTDQEITGTKTFTKQQKFTVAEGTAPFVITSNTLVANLNSDKLDGFHASSLFQSLSNIASTDISNPNTIAIKIGETTKYLKVGYATKAGSLISKLVLKIKSGTTEGTDLYTYDGSNSKTLDIRAGSNITLGTSSGILTISSTNTTYILSGALSGNTFITTLTPSSGDPTKSTIPAMTGATSSSAGKAGLVPAPGSGKNTSFLKGDGTWAIPLDTKVTSVDNHYTPEADLTKTLGATASSTTSATWGSTDLITGIKLSRDAKGHVTGITVDSIQLPSNPNINTWRPVMVNDTEVATSTTDTGTLNLKSGTGITVSGTKVNNITITNTGVRSVAIGSENNSDKVVVNTGGTTTYLTIPYATRSSSADYIKNHGNLTAVSGTTTMSSGLRLYSVYSNGYPCSYGNLLRVGGSGSGELLCSWTGDTSLGRLYYRSKRDVVSTSWSGWGTVAWTSDIPTKVSQLTNDSGYVTGGPYLPLSGGTMNAGATIKTAAMTSGSILGGINCGGTNIYLTGYGSSALLVGGELRFSSSKEWDYNTWAGLKYVHSSKIIYLGLADNSAFTANTAQSGGKLYTPGISNIYIGNGSYTVIHSGNYTSYFSDTDTWRPITNSYSGTATDTSLSQKGANDLYNALVNGYASSSGYSGYISGASISNLNSPTTWSSDGSRLVYDIYSGSASNKPVSQDNANGVITLFKGKHGTTGQYVTQIAAPDNGRLYVRYSQGGSWIGWKTVAFTSDIPSVPSIPSITATTTGSGNAITSVSASGHTITFTKGSTFLTSHQSLANCLRSTSWVTNPGQDANSMTNNTMNFTYSNNAPYTGPIIYFAGAAGGTYGMQINATYNGGGYNLAFRTRNGDNGTWNSWHRLARAAEIPTTMAWGNITGKPTTFNPASHTHDYLPLSNSSTPVVSCASTGVVNFKSTGTVEAGIRLYLGNTNGGGLWYGTSHGTYVYNAPSADLLGITNAGVPYYSSDGGSTKYTLYHTGNLTIPTVTNYYWANVKVSASSSTSTYPTFANMKSTGRIYAGEWIEFSGNTGLYWPNTYGAHFYPNNTSTYGQFKLLGSKGDYSGILFGSSNSFLTVMSTATHHGLYHEGGGIWEFYYNSSSKGVGIRTSTITKNFNVSGTSYLSGQTWIGGTDGGSTLNVIGSAYVSTKLSIGSWVSSYTLQVSGNVYFGHTGTENCLVVSTPNSGSGYTSASIKASCPGSNNWGFHTNGKVSCYTVTNTSDRNMKRNIEYITQNDELLKNVDNIEFASFNYIDSSEVHYGFIAQDFEEYYPEVVYYGNKEEGEYLQLDYNACFVLKIANLERKIKILEKQLESVINNI